LETDFEIGHTLKERIIPRAILFYLGEIEYDSYTFTDYDDCQEDDEENNENVITEEGEGN
jgi:nucleosome assembly protein 1-like 1